MMKIKEVILTLALVAGLALTNYAFGQDQTEARRAEQEAQKVEDKETMAGLKDEKNETKTKAKEAQRIEHDANDAAKESKNAYRTEKKAQKARRNADAQAKKAAKARNRSNEN